MIKPILFLVIILMLVITTTANVYAGGPKQKKSVKGRQAKGVEGSTSSYLDCDNILRCGDGGEQEVMKCAREYPTA